MNKNYSQETDKNVKEAVLFTIRDIENEEFFKGVSPEPSQALIDYFISLGDDLTSWLIEEAHKKDGINTADEPSIDMYKSLSEDIQKNADEFEEAYKKVSGSRVCSEELSLVESISNAQDLGKLQLIKENFLSVYEDFPAEEQSRWEPIHCFISQIPDAESLEIEYQQNFSVFSLEDYNIFASTSLNSNVTHCDKEKPLVQHRLGWYHKEDVTTAVCAVYPWSGEMEEDHNKKWAKALISTLEEKYPSIESIILVCHDKDFSGFSGKNEVVTGGLFTDLQEESKKLKSLIVFQHNKSTIIGALKMNKAADIFKTINEYSTGYAKIQESDKNKLNAAAHDSFWKQNVKNETNEEKLQI